MTVFLHERVTEHRGADDLLSAGLGLDGLRAATPPPFADVHAPMPCELRRRALWSSWRGIADLSPAGGYGSVYGAVPAVPGREYAALARLPGARHPHRVLVQVPDGFDRRRRGVVVVAASGSRGVYGGIAVGAAWGLPKGYAVVHTDKGAGSDYVDLATGLGPRVDGTVGEGADRAFAIDGDGADGVAFKHAHSQDNPEADWGRHVRQAADYALDVLGHAFPDEPRFTFDTTRIVAVGVSNGGGAVLRAAELEGDWLDAVVAGEPNVHVPGSRPLYDVATEAALLMPCALLALDDVPQPPTAAQLHAIGRAQCAALAARGLLDGGDLAAQARDALARLRAGGWTDDALRGGALAVAFDLWRAVAAGYASAYARATPDAHPCGYRYAAVGADGAPRAPTAVERAAWWSDASGIPPGAGVALLDPASDTPLDGLLGLRALWTGTGEVAERVRASIAATRAAPPRAGLPVVVVHGVDDGLVPMAHTSAPYVAAVRAAGRDVRFWQVRHAQHFDAFLGLPACGARYVPLLPYMYAALDRVDAYLDGRGALPCDAVVQATPRGAAPLGAAHLAMP